MFSWSRQMVFISLIVIQHLPYLIGWVNGRKHVTLTSRFSSQESTGMIVQGKPSKTVKIRLSKQEESVLKHLLGRSAQWTLILHDGRVGFRMNATRMDPGKDGIPKSPSHPGFLWSRASKQSSGGNGSLLGRLAHKNLNKTQTPSLNGTADIMRMGYTGLDPTGTEGRTSNQPRMTAGSGNQTRKNTG